MTVPARFITLEGGEGAGKSTQVKRLSVKLAARGIANIVTREPGGSSGAEEIRALLVQGAAGRWDAMTETLLIFAARNDHLANTIRPALDAGKWVICDRFMDSTYAYQGAGRGLDRETIRRLESASVGDFKPDLTLLLDLPVEIGLARARARAGSETRFESFDSEFHERLRRTFLDIARRSTSRCVVVDASGNEDEVEQRIWDAVAARFALH